jgi:hypothetical protein
MRVVVVADIDRNRISTASASSDVGSDARALPTTTQICGATPSGMVAANRARAIFTARKNYALHARDAPSDTARDLRNSRDVDGYLHRPLQCASSRADRSA